jgi:hypothetical protein
MLSRLYQLPQQSNEHCLSTTEPLPTPTRSAAAETASAASAETAEPSTTESAAMTAPSAAIDGACTERSEDTTTADFAKCRKSEE